MSTPKNEKKQFQRQSLSAAKNKGPVKGLKNVLMQPQEMKWPILRDEIEKEELYNLLNELLPVKTRPERIISWKTLRKMSKNERLTLKKEAQSKEKPIDPILSKIIVGVNAVTRALEKGTVCSVLLESNVDPFFMIKHIIIMGRNKNIPVLLIPFLKKITTETIGFPCLVVALKDSNKMPDGHFYKLHELISRQVSEFPPPKICAQLFAEDDEGSETILKKLPIPPDDFSLLSSIYLYRSSPNERAFTPPSTVVNAIETKVESSEGNLWPEFISLGDDTEMMEFDNNKSKLPTRYVDINKKPMKVKRVKGNPNRTKATKISKPMKKQLLKKKNSV